MLQNEPINIIRKGITIRGSLSGGGDLVVEGQVEGLVDLKNHLTIETTGKVQADIRAEQLTINGEASGNIDASSRVAINASALVSGDIRAPRIVIENGAIFNGSIEMDVKLPDDI
ncbi:MAG: bactofilin BacN [Proteobacteria bacterium]|nr:bactofilin BacN [Cystobacterineae bacterium]MCL2259622.1 bactofilin BacN [Cystobacterineae bacterium]MCL2313873.1 bactofilin BacN [Pseudomonadota bacterium]